MSFNKFILYSTILLLFVSCKQKEETIQQLVDKGVDLVNEKRYEEAIVLYSKAIIRNPKVQLAYYNRGIAYTDLQNYSKALSDFNKIIQLQTGGVFLVNRDFSPSDEGLGQVPYNDVLYQRAIVKSYMDSLQSSFIDFQLLINDNYEEKSNCLLWQGTLLGRNGKHDKACEYFKKAKESALTVAENQSADDNITKYCKQTKDNR